MTPELIEHLQIFFAPSCCLLCIGMPIAIVAAVAKAARDVRDGVE